MDTSGQKTHGGLSGSGRFHTLIDNLLEACQVIDFDWRYVYMNPSALRQNRMASADQAIGKTMMEFFPGIDQLPVFVELRRCMEQRVPTQTETEFTFPDGTIGWFEVRCEPVPEGIFILSIDVTERKLAEETLRRTEEQLRQAQKMEAIGRLAAGIAHDFNNLLTVIILANDMVLDQLPAGDKNHGSLLQVQQAGERAAALTRQLLAFSRQQVLAPRVLDFNAVVGDTETMLRRLISEDIALTVNLAPDLGNVKADAGQVEQAVLNLALNARDAMPTGGRLLIETRNVELNGDYTEKYIDMKPGRYILLAVSDTGSGMDAETRNRIFEPFFTTKSQGKGTGLGLSTVFGIVKQSGGSIRVYSEPGRGSEFEVYLPRINEAVTEAPAPVDDDFPGGDETILLVEDDEQVRAVTTMALELAGYRVIAVSRGQEAVRRCETWPGPIHLLISDVIMPDMGGRKVAESIRALRPDIRTLFVSGHTDDAVVRYGIELQESAFLQKPFTPDSLARKVREVLGRR